MPKVECRCEYCGKQLFKYPSRIHEHVFCSRACLGKAVTAGVLVKDTTKTSANMSQMNREMNPTRMTREVREKISLSRMQAHVGDQTYAKHLSKHEHREVAERVLGRKLRPGEVVHHINDDKQDNRPENLMVFESQAEHARWHAEHDPNWGKKKCDR